METLIQSILIGSIFVLKLAQAMRIELSDLALIRREPINLLRSIVAVDVLVPLTTLAVILIIRPPRATEIGLAVAAAAPAAPLFFSSAVSAGGRVSYVACLQFAVSLLAVLTTPITLAVLAKILRFEAEVDALAIARQTVVALFLPMCLGMLIRARLPNIAARVGPILRTVGGFSLLLVTVAVTAKAYPLLLAFDLRSYLAVVVTVAAALTAGWLMGLPSRPGDRTALGIACASRNPGLAMLIASLNFPGGGATHVLIPYLFASSLTSTVYTCLVRKGETHLRSSPTLGIRS